MLSYPTPYVLFHFKKQSDNWGITENHFLNQACVDHRPARAWFLKIDPVRIVGVHVCVSAPEAINN